MMDAHDREQPHDDEAVTVVAGGKTAPSIADLTGRTWFEAVDLIESARGLAYGRSDDEASASVASVAACLATLVGMRLEPRPPLSWLKGATPSPRRLRRHERTTLGIVEALKSSRTDLDARRHAIKTHLDAATSTRLSFERTLAKTLRETGSATSALLAPKGDPPNAALEAEMTGFLEAMSRVTTSLTSNRDFVIRFEKAAEVAWMSVSHLADHDLPGWIAQVTQGGIASDPASKARSTGDSASALLSRAHATGSALGEMSSAKERIRTGLLHPRSAHGCLENGSRGRDAAIMSAPRKGRPS